MSIIDHKTQHNITDYTPTYSLFESVMFIIYTIMWA